MASWMDEKRIAPRDSRMPSMSTTVTAATTAVAGTLFVPVVRPVLVAASKANGEAA
jgi:CO dehydrogenase/acetyl-CoA synthase delta subunit